MYNTVRFSLACQGDTTACLCLASVPAAASSNDWLLGDAAAGTLACVLQYYQVDKSGRLMLMAEEVVVHVVDFTESPLHRFYD